MHKRLKDVQGEMQTLRDKGFTKGYSIGWDWDALPYSVKLGSTTYMGASPGSGKTEIILEILINLSCLHGLNHVIFTPETGNAQEIYAELCHKYIGKTFIKGIRSMTDGERISAEMFVDEHFVVVDPLDEDLTITGFYELVDKIEKNWKRVDTTLIDPWNELTEEFIPEDLGREDKYLNRILRLVKKNATKNNRHNFIVTHVRDQTLVTKDGKSYYPPPHARELAGGQVWFRKGNSIIMPWRPPNGLLSEEGEMYRENELHFKIAKSKPKGVSMNGTYKLYLDTERYQYYMINIVTGGRIYANRDPEQVKVEQLKAIF